MDRRQKERDGEMWIQREQDRGTEREKQRVCAHSENPNRVQMNISTHYWSRHCHSHSLSQPLPTPTPSLSILRSLAVRFKFVSCFSSSLSFSLSLVPSLVQTVSHSYGAPGYNQITDREMECIRNWHAVQFMCACEHALLPNVLRKMERSSRGSILDRSGFRVWD